MKPAIWRQFLKDLEEFGDVTVERDRAIICLVGEQMKRLPLASPHGSLHHSTASISR